MFTSAANAKRGIDNYATKLITSVISERNMRMSAANAKRRLDTYPTNLYTML